MAKQSFRDLGCTDNCSNSCPDWKRCDDACGKVRCSITVCDCKPPVRFQFLADRSYADIPKEERYYAIYPPYDKRWSEAYYKGEISEAEYKAATGCIAKVHYSELEELAKTLPPSENPYRARARRNNTQNKRHTYQYEVKGEWLYRVSMQTGKKFREARLEWLSSDSLAAFLAKNR